MLRADGPTATWERAILEAVNDIIYSVEGDVFAGRVTFVNGQVERILGYRAQDFVDDASLWIRSVHPDDMPRLMETTRAMIEQAAPVTRVFRVRHKDGNRFVWFDDRVVPKVGADGRVQGVLGIARDITARREAELELERTRGSLQRLEAIGRFTTGIAHDLNNIFAVLAAGFEDSDERWAFRDVGPGLRDASRRGAELTRRLLLFARGETAPARLLDLNAIIEDMVALLQRILGADVEVVTRLVPALGPVRGDATQIQQLLLNLAANARDAMDCGGTLTIVTENGAASNPHRALLRVSDTGSGMDEGSKNRLFDAFFTTKTDGTGIGLATVKQIVDELGGAIRVDSKRGCGTTFEIELPVVTDASA